MAARMLAVPYARLGYLNIAAGGNRALTLAPLGITPLA